MGVLGTLGFNFQVIIPLLADRTFGGEISAYSLLTIAMGAGSICGALTLGARNQASRGLIALAALGFGVASLLAAVAPTLPLMMAALALLGVCSVTFAAGINSGLQLAAAPEMRGRIMALYSIVFLGSTPIGGPITGLLSGAFGARSALLMAGVAALAAGAGAAVAFSRATRTRVSRERAEVEEASPVGHGRDRGPECEPAEPGEAPKSARRRSEHRRGPRSPARPPRAGATRAR